MADRVVEEFLGTQLVAAFYKGEFQGRVYGPGRSVLTVTGTDIPDVLTKLRALVDTPERQAALRAHQRAELIEKHGALLRQRGIAVEEVSVQELLEAHQRFHRASFCWRCKAEVDNSVHLECTRCNWILCANCAACGCTHPTHGPLISAAITARRGRADARLDRVFGNFDDALQFVKQHPGSVLRRSGERESWSVTLVPPD